MSSAEKARGHAFVHGDEGWISPLGRRFPLERLLNRRWGIHPTATPADKPILLPAPTPSPRTGPLRTEGVPEGVGPALRVPWRWQRCERRAPGEHRVPGHARFDGFARSIVVRVQGSEDREHAPSEIGGLDRIGRSVTAVSGGPLESSLPYGARGSSPTPGATWSSLDDLSLRQHLLHMRNEAAILEDGQYFRRQRREAVGLAVMFDGSCFEIDADLVTRLDRVGSFSKFDDR